MARSLQRRIVASFLLLLALVSLGMGIALLKGEITALLGIVFVGAGLFLLFSGLSYLFTGKF